MSELLFYVLMLVLLFVAGLFMWKYLNGTPFSDIDRQSRFESSLLSGRLKVLDFETVRERKVHKPGYGSATVYDIKATVIIPDQ